ncbi:kinase-like domain-containing protein, partial [Entophlyctis helioformis]
MSSAYGTSPPPTLGRPSTPTPRPSSSTSPTAKPLTRKIPLEIHMMRQFTARGNPHMIRYFEHFEINERFIIVMEYLGQDWMDLYDYIEMYGPVPEAHTRQIFRQVVDTIAGMHRLGYCHNDIKDENIMIHTKTREIKLIDFGSTTKLEPGISTNIFYGTKKFAAPEAIQGKSYFPDAHEVWALGTLLYVLLFKMDPFKSDDEVL